ncbi:hypothetical protein [Sphingopyxis indica]|nr:hypothetical protein [Sphingopyxis indica]
MAARSRAKRRARLAARRGRAILFCAGAAARYGGAMDMETARGRRSREVVLGRLRTAPVLAWAGAAAAGLVWALWELLWGGGFAASGFYRLLGPLTGPLIVAIFGYATFDFGRMFALRRRYLRHDGVRLYRGADRSWPLANIRDVVVTRGALGIGSLRLVVDDDSETTRELAKLYMLEGPVEAVRGAVLFATGRPVPLSPTLH